MNRQISLFDVSASQRRRRQWNTMRQAVLGLFSRDGPPVAVNLAPLHPHHLGAALGTSLDTSWWIYRPEHSRENPFLKWPQSIQLNAVYFANSQPCVARRVEESPQTVFYQFRSDLLLLFISESEPALRDVRERSGIPSRHHDAQGSMRIGSQQKVPDFMTDDCGKQVRRRHVVPAGILHRAVPEDVDKSRSQEGFARNRLFQFLPGTGENVERVMSGIMESSTAGISCQCPFAGWTWRPCNFNPCSTKYPSYLVLCPLHSRFIHGSVLIR